MSDGDDNILNFPTSPTIQNISSVLNDQEREEKRKSAITCLEDAIVSIENNENLTGVVCLMFEHDNIMHDTMGGDVSASMLYVMLDKLKKDVMKIICDTIGYGET
jgi:hypothetical protein